MTPDTPLVLVLGASGYVGGRLIPELLRVNLRVRCMSRRPENLQAIPWAADVDIVAGDLADPASLADSFVGVDHVVYLVHSLDGADFESRELEAARNARQACDAAGVPHLVFLGGLGDDNDDLSPHLRSRHAVGVELSSGSVAVTELRAAVILGSGSASFEMLRSLVEVLPVMIAPLWVTRTRVQPVAIADVITYLVAALELPVDGHHRIVQIGAPDQLTYRELMDAYAEAAGLPRRLVVPVPVLSPRLSTHWVNLVTPLPRTLAASLIESLRNDVVVADDSADVLIHHRSLTVSAALERALAAIDDLEIPTRWSGYTPRERSAQPAPWDPSWSGGTVYEDRRERTIAAPAESVQRVVVRGIGGDRGWFGFALLWRLRGTVDKILGGVGLRRGRRHPDDIAVGEALDFWRVVAADKSLFRLHAGDEIAWGRMARMGDGRLP